MKSTSQGVFVLVVLSLILMPAVYGHAASKGAQDCKLSAWTNIRFRYEYQDNFNGKFYGDAPQAGKSNDNFLLGRFRFGLHYYPHEMIHLSVGTQHSEAWDLALEEGDFYNSRFGRFQNPYEDDWEPFNTYLEIKKLLPFSIKAGRQIITYGNRRIYGPGQWGNTGRWQWDALMFHYPFEGGFLDAYYGGTKVHDPSHLSWKHNHGFESVGFYGHFELPERLLGMGFEPFSMTKVNDHDRYTGEDGQVGNFDAYYFGARLFAMDYRGFDFDVTFIKQEGDRASDDVDAYGYHCLVGYRFKEMAFKPRVTLEYSYASGDSDPTDGTLETFDGAFGAKDKMYGRMNLFAWQNLKDAQVNLELKPRRWFSFTGGYHQFWLAEQKDGWSLNPKAHRDKTGSSGDKVGRELDLIFKLDFSKGHEVQFGYGHFWPDEFAKNVASHEEANWVFLQWMWKYSSPLLQKVRL
ncbi:MAG: alginate export family protein [Thermodesulfobacteriota bacterium]|nr:alginate export family protein [Thermodesulfobacteriota bacterium]